MFKSKKKKKLNKVIIKILDQTIVIIFQEDNAVFTF